MVARDGSEALALAGRHAGQIDLLVSDVIMPDMNGRVLSQRLTQGRPTIKTLYLSGYTDDALFQHAVMPDRVVGVAGQLHRLHRGPPLPPALGQHPADPVPPAHVDAAPVCR